MEYYNITYVVPYNMTMAVAYSGKGDYNVTYSTKSHTSSLSGTALFLGLNLSTGNVYSSKYSGAFADLTTSQLISGYSSMSADGICGIYLGA
jgi:hypothetical protein